MSAAWDLAHAPLGPGKLLLEASAGTGKTYTIERLVAVLVAEMQVPLPQILVVTFTEAAAAELRGRVRELLAVYAARLGARAPTDEEIAEDPLLQRLRLAAVPWPAAALRLRAACQAFDSACISTIHGFCQTAIARYALQIGAPAGAELLPDPKALLADFAADWVTLNGYADARCAELLAAMDLGAKNVAQMADRATQFAAAPLTPAADAPTWDLPSAADALHELGRQLRGAVTLQQAELLQRLVDSGAFTKETPPEAARQLVEWRRQPSEWPPLPRVKAKAFTQSWPTLLVTDNVRVNQRKAVAAEPSAVAALAAIEEFARQARELFVAAATDVCRSLYAAARTAVQQRLAQANQLTFADLIALVAGAVRREQASPPGQRPLTDGLRASFAAALIDEFQDTDAAQWAIFDGVFGQSAAHRLFLVGDPKQAIYAFRGADVLAYCHAARSVPAGRSFTLTKNHRSDPQLVDAISRLYRRYPPHGGPSEDRPGIFGAGDIGFPLVTAAKKDRWRAGNCRELAAPLCIRWFDAATCQTAGRPNKDKATETLGKVVAADVARLLASGAQIGQGEQARPVTAGDVAVLVRTNSEAALVQGQLQALGIAAVVSSSGNVLQTAEAQWLRCWLAAIDDPADRSACRLLAASGLCGWPASALGDQPEDAPIAAAWLALQGSVKKWRDVYDKKGFFAAWQTAMADPHACVHGPGGALLRLLGAQGGARCVTNLRHLAELGHGEFLARRPTPQALADWFAAMAQRKGDGDAYELRLETDDRAVRISTVHKAKGLQYPVVFVPFLWSGKTGGQGDELGLVYHGPANADGHRPLHIDIGRDKGHPRRAQVESAAAREAKEEGLRVLYVALTRAEHQCVVYWGLAGKPGGDATSAPLAALLHGDDPADPVADRIDTAAQRVDAGLRAKDGAAFRGELAAHLAQCGGAIELSDCAPAAADSAELPGLPAATAGADLAAAVWPAERHGLGDGWRVWSYSGFPKRHAELDMDADAAPPAVAAQADDADDADDPEDAADDGLAVVWPTDDVAAEPVALDGAGLAGADFGKWVHAVLEHTDFVPAGAGEPVWQRRAVASDGGAQERWPLERVAAELAVQHGVRHPQAVSTLCQALPAVLDAPLGGELGALRLRDLRLADRLDELRFDFALPAAAAARQTVLEPLAHRQAPPQWPPAMRANWQAYLRQLQLWDADRETPVHLRGLFTGSIDLLFRAPGQQRFFVVDYKTNRIGGPRPADGGRAPCHRGHFAPPFLLAEMCKHHYILQYHLYLCAVHRYLRHRVADYDYDRHVGGALYLFLRGMGGEPAAGQWGNGVFFDRPPRQAIEAMCTALFGAEAA